MTTYQGQEFSALLHIYAKASPDELGHCISSILAQSVRPSELVIVEDGPITQGLEQVLDRHSREWVRRVRLPRHRGLGTALQEGLAKCSYSLVARVDADDVSVPRRFEWQLAHFASNPKTAVLGGILSETFFLNRNNARPVQFNRVLPVNPVKLQSFAKFRNPINHPTVMFRKEAVLAVGGYQDCPYFEDYFLWARMLKAGHPFANLPQVLVETEANDDYFDRRSGEQYRLHERDFARKLSEIGFHSRLEGAVFLLSRIPLRWMSKGLMRKFYAGMLRRASSVVEM